MIEHQLAGMQSLSSLLIREELYGLNREEIDVLLATVLLLVLYDVSQQLPFLAGKPPYGIQIRESGISSHGVHLTGTAYICRKISQQPTAMVSPRTAFLIATLACIPTASPWFKRLLFPLLIAGAETSVPHQQRFVEMCIGEIKRKTGFQQVAMTQILGKVWEGRARQVDRSRNVPWMEYTCSVDLSRLRLVGAQAADCASRPPTLSNLRLWGNP
ncbi:hypothetical protein BO86DRAFT_404222 [Aspergillus japonicus CBS 114.51]|uniref:Uncharacterized protein n=1 Tax=Aspergillus japonicus CBS 114.51 TaxID=1448312 RepID=A0A8T8WNC2_ASPJA|nr:hypothetical protein BO86DRAFT_404222 [Aspergillus japonicus CBS 114.51]RAH76899.1 hypothetical protein BO86DRAFT_404222 [Aspergillus japonicus CBS 114.51]